MIRSLNMLNRVLYYDKLHIKVFFNTALVLYTSLSNLVVERKKKLFDNHGHAMSLSHDVTIISALNWGLMPLHILCTCDE